MTGISTHFDDAHDQLERDPFLQQLFSRVEHAAAASSGGGGAGQLRIPSYQTATRLMPRLSSVVTIEAMAANVALMRALRTLLPHAGIGERLMIDGTLIPAWAPQVGSGGDPEREERLRRFANEAGFRAYKRTKEGKRPIEPGDKLRSGLRAGRVKAVRGYSLVVIADQATGHPLVWQLQDASDDEALAIVPLLSLLHSLWPAVDAELISGDGAWDEDEWCRVCEVDYALHPVFRHGEAKRKAVEDESRDGSITAISGDGHLICRHHNCELAFETCEIPPRLDLAPGQSTDERRFRIRAMCKNGPHPCGKVGLKMEADWSRLTFYPHHANGKPRRHAMRLALLDRLAGIEQLFDRLKCGKGLGNAGAGRERVRDRATHEALISMAFLSMTALLLADQRQQAGVPVSLPPAPPEAEPQQSVADRAAGNGAGQGTAAAQPARPELAPTVTSTAGAREPLSRHSPDLRRPRWNRRGCAGRA